MGSSLSVPTDGTWVATRGSPATRLSRTSKVLSWGITAPNSGAGVASGKSYQCVMAAGSSNAANQTLTSPTIDTTHL
jgi:hypothetical protein